MAEDGSSRLRDRAASEFQRRRQQAAQGSTRLRDTAQSQFQRRRQQAQRAREAIDEGAMDFAAALDLEPGDIRPVQLDDRGEQIGFVPDDRGRSTLAQRFAEQRPFVEPGDVFVDANPRTGVLTRTDPDDLDRIGERAERDFASEVDFINARDLEAQVGPGGVEDITTRPGRRDDIGQRVASDLAADDPFAEAGDFAVDVGPQGIEDARFTPAGQRRRATRQFTDMFDVFGPGDLDPETDIREIGGGFGLTRGAAREVAAADIDQQLPNIDIGPGDIELEETQTGGFEAIFEREVRR
ncbi:MAG: hypothetical protein RI560_08925 [Natronomonas sp.]|nr:hypothetical protein [Natronomonas sp.]